MMFVQIRKHVFKDCNHRLRVVVHPAICKARKDIQSPQYCQMNTLMEFGSNNLTRFSSLSSIRCGPNESIDPSCDLHPPGTYTNPL
mmetsp:Transcript_27514/g.47677  ORF Transcript_27514/g.47677 Transcript_27514/m.47677 type:complete len:86 (-) Transcript_27514:424-681(-)